jgi:hypothetical protein
VLLLKECLLLFISLSTQSGNFWIHPRMYVCMYVCVYVCSTYVYMCVCVFICIYVCVCMFMCMNVCMYVRMYVGDRIMTATGETVKLSMP